MLSSKTKAYFALLTTAALWGIAGPVIKATLAYLPPFTFLFYRFFLVIIITLPWYFLYLKKHPLKWSDLLPLSFLGFLATTLNLGLIFVGFEKTTALDGTLLSSVTPIFIVILGVTFLKEKVKRHEFLGLILVVVGSFITVVQPLLESQVFAWQNAFGNLLILIAGFVWAGFVLFSKKSFSHFPPLLITLHSSMVAFITFLPLALWESNFPLLLSNFKIHLLPSIIYHPEFLGVFYMAFISYLLAYFLYEYGMSKIEISEGSIFAYLQPIFAAPFALLWLGESITLPFVAGAAIIALGVVLSEWK